MKLRWVGLVVSSLAAAWAAAGAKNIEQGRRSQTGIVSGTARRIALFLILISWTPAASIIAQTRPQVLPMPCEAALAASAAPKHLQDQASVYVLKDAGYVKYREGSNGFTCIVNRDDPHSLKPVCFDAEGSRTVLPKIIEVGALLMKGTPAAEIRQVIGRMFSEGKLQRPARPGVAYMLSQYNRPWIAAAGRLGWFPPHLMFYAPDLTNQDIGFDRSTFNSEIYLPFVAYQGPHGFMIVRVADGNHPEEAPLPDCPAWVTAE